MQQGRFEQRLNMFQEILFSFGSIKEHMSDTWMLQEESLEIVGDCRVSLNVRVHAGFADA